MALKVVGDSSSEPSAHLISFRPLHVSLKTIISPGTVRGFWSG